MPHRAFALFLACLVLWAALGTQETRHGAGALAASGTAAAAAPAEPPRPGSVEDHHLDDLPAQAAAEPHADVPGMPPASQPAPGAATLAGHPAPGAEACGPAPFLDGPQRPPEIST